MAVVEKIAPATARVMTDMTQTIGDPLDATAASSGISDARLDAMIALVNELRQVVLNCRVVDGTLQADL